ncbi:MAG: hypothetical protein ACKPHU_12750 [Planctomycetaceae bacterium]
MTTSGSRIPYRRVLLKISGESFCREGESGISMTELSSIASQIRDVVQSGVQLAIDSWYVSMRMKIFTGRP